MMELRVAMKVPPTLSLLSILAVIMSNSWNGEPMKKGKWSQAEEDRLRQNARVSKQIVLICCILTPNLTVLG